jgi:hypothetical protein
MDISNRAGAPAARFRRTVLLVGLPVAVILAAATVASAYDTTWIASGQNVSAMRLKADLDEIQSRLSTLEANGPSPVEYYTEASAGAATTGPGDWMDIPGLQVTFTTTASANVELFALVSMTATGGPSECQIRFVLDASPVGGPTGFEATGDVNPAFAAIPGIIQLTGLRRIPIGAGPHTASVQFEKAVGAFSGSNCVVGGVTYDPNARFRAVVE